MVHAIRIHETGGPEVMRWEEIELSPPGAGEVRIRHTAIGLNYIDTYHRSGVYALPLPAIFGSEAAGVVEQVGPGVSGLKAGDRVAYAMVVGAYAEARNIPADRLVKVPDGVSDQEAAAMMLKGLTAHYLLRRSYRAQKGDTVLFHAAAGGVGLILCQWAKHLGVAVIGTVSNEEKAKLTLAHGCAHAIGYEDFPARVAEITGGAKVPAVYDGVGKDTFAGSLDCLAPTGFMILFGAASGPVPPVDPTTLAGKGSLYLQRPSLGTYVARRADLEAAAAELFEVVSSGAVKVAVNQTYPLREAAQAHRDLEGRKTTGSTVFLV